MDLDKRNILNLIGKNRGKYSSCIISCFTFDFPFFEHKVLSTMRLANIRNVNVFLDGNYLEQALERTSGNEFKTTKTYSLIPIYQQGVFHPKIMFLTGPKHALLVLGSGNLTSSGLNTNDEVWGAFHMNSLESPNAPIFAAAWQYLKSFFSAVKGYNQIKLSWIEQRSPWIKDLEQMVPASFIKIKDREVQFLANNERQSLYQQLYGILPKEKISSLRIVSPYFDRQGKFLEQLLEDYEIEEMSCITDTEFGLLPYKLNDTARAKIDFYKWGDCIANFSKGINRLHAKIFQFKYANGWEYLLIGSPNATINAFGSHKKKAVNAEAALLLRRKSSKDYLEDLKIFISKASPFQLTTQQSNTNNQSTELRSLNKEAKVLCVEIENESIKLFLNKGLTESYELEILNDLHQLIESIKVESSENEFQLKLNSSSLAFKVYLARDGKRISNYALIHFISTQAKCNPDPKQAELTAVFDRLYENPHQDIYMELLKFADYNWVDDELDNAKYKSGTASQAKQVSRHAVDEEYIEMTEEDLYKLDTVATFESSLLNNPTVQMADVLKVVSSGQVIGEEEHIEESEEEALIQQSIDQRDGSGSEVKQTVKSYAQGELEIRAIHKHFNKIKNIYKKQLAALKKEKLFVKSPQRRIVLRDLTNQSIVLNIIYLFWGEKYTLSRTEFSVQRDRKMKASLEKIEKKYQLQKAEKKQTNSSLIHYSAESYLFKNVQKEIIKLSEELFIFQNEYTNQKREEEYFVQGNFAEKGQTGLKQLLISHLGKFLICCNEKAGYKKYDYEQLNLKMISYRLEVFQKAVFLLLSIQWTFGEIKYRDILLLDLLHFIAPDLWFEKSREEVIEEFEAILKKASSNLLDFDKRLSFFLDTIVPRYKKWKGKFGDNGYSLIKIKWINPQQIVFNPHIGFAYFVTEEKGKIHLDKTGFEWDDKKDYLSFVVKSSDNTLVDFGPNFLPHYF